MINTNLVSLKQMAESKVSGVQKTTNFQVDPRLITVQEGFNARPIDPDHVASIKQAYKSGAYLPPLLLRVSEGVIVLVDGHHRHAAILELINEGEEILRVDAIHFRGNDAERIALMLTAAQGKPLTPLEMGLQYKKLVGFGWGVLEISGKVGKSTTHVADMLELAGANTDVHTMVNNKEVAAGVAVKAVKQHGDNAGKVLGEHLNNAKAQGHAKIKPRDIAEPKQKDPPTRGAIAALVAKSWKISIDDADRITKDCFAL